MSSLMNKHKKEKRAQQDVPFVTLEDYKAYFAGLQSLGMSCVFFYCPSSTVSIFSGGSA